MLLHPRSFDQYIFILHHLEFLLLLLLYAFSRNISPVPEGLHSDAKLTIFSTTTALPRHGGGGGYSVSEIFPGSIFQTQTSSARRQFDASADDVQSVVRGEALMGLGHRIMA